VTLLVIVAIAVISVAQLFSRVLGVWGYIIGYPRVVAIMVILIVRQSWKEFPSEAAATSERSISLPVTFSLVCENVPQAVKNYDWKMMLADESHGHFQARIGMNLKTWGQVMQVDLTMADGKSTDISVKCVAHHILWDRG